MSSFAAFRRNCTPGRAVHVDNRYRPEVSGDRIIQKATTANLWMTPPADQTFNTFKTSLDWPKAADTEVSDDALTLTIKFAPGTFRHRHQLAETGSDIFLILSLL